MLYIFVFLHQTATIWGFGDTHIRCISLFSYIKPQLPASAPLIPTCCISLFSYIKPQLLAISLLLSLSCISLFSYIKPQLTTLMNDLDASCISLFSYIKPQLVSVQVRILIVVYLCFPTSNRNPSLYHLARRYVVYLCFPTSNRNYQEQLHRFHQLYIFVFLHQTATITPLLLSQSGCISLFSYIKPQH